MKITNTPARNTEDLFPWCEVIQRGNMNYIVSADETPPAPLISPLSGATTRNSQSHMTTQPWKGISFPGYYYLSLNQKVELKYCLSHLPT